MVEVATTKLLGQSLVNKNCCYCWKLVKPRPSLAIARCVLHTGHLFQLKKRPPETPETPLEPPLVYYSSLDEISDVCRRESHNLVIFFYLQLQVYRTAYLYLILSKQSVARLHIPHPAVTSLFAWVLVFGPHMLGLDIIAIHVSNYVFSIFF